MQFPAPAIAILILSPAAPALAGVDYSREIQPLLAEHCFHCHGKDDHSRKGKLRLDERDAALLGGKSDGPAIVPGQPEKSALIARLITHDEDELMPPAEEKKPVNAADLEKLRQWIREGAPYSGHWAFKSPVKRPLPEVRTPGPQPEQGSPEGAKALNPVDAWISARLEKEGLTISPPAAPETICRRLHLDLIGLPPTPAELDAFVEDAKTRGLTAAVGAKADALMKDRRFGEKWARHWLDVARYADSNGFEKDMPREQWIWREWVINALNKDTPYDQFVIEQIAGDLLPDATPEQIIATGFLRNGMINEEGAIIPEEWRMEGMFDRMDAVGSGIMGLSVKCGQCHTHKFDPITHTEYYGLFAFLNNTYEAKSWVYAPEARQTITKVADDIRRAEGRLKKAHPEWEKQMAAWEAEQLKQWRATQWTVVHPEDTHSSTELNHPEVLADDSVLVLGHPTTKGDIHFMAEPKVENVTGIRVEVLTHGDLPMNGPGRSFKGTWALTELTVEAKKPGADKWEPLKLKDATADFEEPLGGMEPEWENKTSDKDDRRVRGPAALLADGNPLTGWRADRGAGRRNTESLAVARFDMPVTLPPGTKIKVALLMEHGGDGSGQRNAQIGRFRVALTQSPEPKAAPVAYAALLAMQTPLEKRTAAQEQAIFDAWRTATPAMKVFNDQIEKAWREYPEPQTSVLHLAERKPEDARETKRLDRGVWSQGKEVVRPRTVAALHSLPRADQATRLDFARWLVDKRSPLAARVAVNRLWQHIFGIGIVETAEDFGTRAPEPSHPELLDWLAVDFMEHGWSQKYVLRLLVTSAAYLRDSRATPDLLERDPKNRLLARGPRFRGDAEVVRDIALSVSGLLDGKFGGPSIFPPVPQSVLDYNYFKPDYWAPPEDSTRYSRALYVFRKRSMPDPTLIAFDAPTGDTACTRRPRSNSPLAALTAMNEPVFVEAAQAMALRVLREGGGDDAAKINHAFRLCTSRMPTEGERGEIARLLNAQRDRLKSGELKASEIAFSSLTKPSAIPADATPNEVAAWAIVSRVLLNLDETLAKN